MKKKIEFGKVAYTGKARTNSVDITIELKELGGEEVFTIDPITKEKKYAGRTTPKYYEFTASGHIWNKTHTWSYCAGQCLDTIAKYVHSAQFKEVYELWKRYHLNGMHAGTPEQEAKIAEWIEAGNRYDYTEVCEMLKECGLYEVNFTGKTVGRIYDNEPYKYGCGWVIEDIPEEVRARIIELIEQ